MSFGRLRSLQQLTSLRLVSFTLQQQLQQQQQCQSHVMKTAFQSGLVRMFATGISKQTIAWKIRNQEGFFVAFLFRIVI